MALHPQEISSVTVSELQQLTFSQLSLNKKVTIKKKKKTHTLSLSLSLSLSLA
jgi:hypothetical protein